MNGKLIGSILIALALIAGAGMYYLQVYAFYDEVTLAEDGGDIRLSVTRGGALEAIPVAAFRGIDSESSPIRFRACFEVDAAELDGADPHPDPVPLNAPGWFDCFDAAALGAALEAGEARAYLGEANVTYGIDRIIAVYPDGRAFAWHQINLCGEEVFDGRPAPAGCPPAPQGNS